MFLSATIRDYYLSHNERHFMCRADYIHLGYKLHHKHFDNRDHSQQGLCDSRNGLQCQVSGVESKNNCYGLAGCIRWGQEGVTKTMNKDASPVTRVWPH